MKPKKRIRYGWSGFKKKKLRTVTIPKSSTKNTITSTIITTTIIITIIITITTILSVLTKKPNSFSN